MSMEAKRDIIISVHNSEKSTRLLQEQNKISFIVSKSANKFAIRKELESEFKIKIAKINIINKMNGDRVAIVKLKPEYPATDLATKLGLI